MKLRVKFEPRDIWIGAFVDTEKRKLYVCVVPCLPIILSTGEDSRPVRIEDVFAPTVDEDAEFMRRRAAEKLNPTGEDNDEEGDRR